jgi:hypothetical protein
MALNGRKKDEVGVDGGGGKTCTGGSRIDEPRGRALPANGAANEVMFFQEGEDAAERQRPTQYLRAGLTASASP